MNLITLREKIDNDLRNEKALWADYDPDAPVFDRFREDGRLRVKNHCCRFSRNGSLNIGYKILAPDQYHIEHDKIVLNDCGDYFVAREI